MRAAKLRPLALAMCLALPAQAAEPTAASLLLEIQKLQQRLEKLEARNTELEKQAGQKGDSLTQRVKSLETTRDRLETALENDSISENEPQLAARLKASESQVLAMQKQSRTVEALEGISAGASFTTVAQKAYATLEKDSQLNFRADITASTPAGEIADMKGKIFGHFRIGQGKGLGSALTAFSGANTSAFQLGTVEAADSSAVMLAQAWYQLDIPLPVGGYRPHSRETVSVNFGKMDPFAFFDQNTAANDETRQFLASMFVHNALLDNPLAANIGADAFGFSPGIRVSYLNEKDKREPFRLTLGVFGAGAGASFGKSFKSPFVIGQAETRQRLFDGLEGNYRLFFWQNGQAPTYLAGETARHRGVGVNFDQRLGDEMTLFGRYGKAWGQRLPFAQTLSLGAEIRGGYWARGGDALGLAFGLNRTSKEFREDAAAADADGDGTPDYGFAAGGSEKVAEIYYRWRLNKQFEITPDFQLIGRPAGNGDANTIKLLGARAQITF